MTCSGHCIYAYMLYYCACTHLPPWPPCTPGTCRTLSRDCRPQWSRRQSQTARWPSSPPGRPWLSPWPSSRCRTVVPGAPPTSISVTRRTTIYYILTVVSYLLMHKCILCISVPSDGIFFRYVFIGERVMLG